MSRKLQFSLVVADTFSRLQAVSTMLEAFQKELPALEASARQRIKRHASADGWSYEDFVVEDGVISNTFENWIPAFSAYSVIILNYSIVEAQLMALASYLGAKRESKLRVTDMAGQGIDRSALYLDRVLALKVKTDPAWGCLKDIQKLRNCIVHGNGKPEGDFRHRVAQLSKKYKGLIGLRGADGFGSCEQVWISFELCEHFLTESCVFFERQFKLAGLSSASSGVKCTS